MAAVRLPGLEPGLPFGHQHLELARQPISPEGRDTGRQAAGCAGSSGGPKTGLVVEATRNMSICSQLNHAVERGHLSWKKMANFFGTSQLGRHLTPAIDGQAIWSQGPSLHRVLLRQQSYARARPWTIQMIPCVLVAVPCDSASVARPEPRCFWACQAGHLGGPWG